MAQQNEALVEYFESGIKAAGEPGRLGVELEHIITDGQYRAVPYGGPDGIGALLEEMAGDYAEELRDEEGDLLGLQNPGAALSLEPAAQLELSAGPYEEIGAIRCDFEEFHRSLAKVLERRGQRTVIVGYQPHSKADELTLIPKDRYRFMDEHFAAIGPYGRFMMRGSASTQISIDYHSTADCLRKLRLTSAASPLFALICDNSAVFEGQPAPHRLMRTEIWRECDPARCNLVPGVLDPSFTLEDYAAYVLATPAVYARDEEGRLYATEQTFAELFAERPMDREDVEHALSMLFNDVRLKTYIEIRTADAMPVPFVAAYAALIKGLFYDEANLDGLDGMFDGVTEADAAVAKASLMDNGYEARVYGRCAGDLVDELFERAYNALARNERSYLIPLRQMASKRTTLASMGR